MHTQPATVPAAPGGAAAQQPSAMRTVRRLYVYAVAAATLVIAAIGLTQLLGLGIDRLLEAVTGETWLQGGPDEARQRLSLSVPFIVIATPIWYLHWRMAQRATHGEDADAERRSLVRAFYFLGVVLVSVFTLLPNLTQLVQFGTERLLGGRLDIWQREAVVMGLASTIVIGAVWLFHQRVYRQDVREETAETRAAVLPQVGLYLAAGIGGVFLLFGAGELVRLAVDAVADIPRFGQWWHDPLASGLSMVLTGAVIWTGHWFFAERTLATSSWWGGSAQGSQLRRGYLLVLLLITGFMTLFFLAEGVQGAVGAALEVDFGRQETALTEIAGPLLMALPFIGFWLLHRSRLLAEPRGRGFPLAEIGARRMLGYAMAALGLLFGAAGVAVLIGELVQAVTGGDGWRADVGWPVGLLLGGVALWAWYWRGARARLATNPLAEQIATSRRAYLFVVLAVALVALVVGLAMTVYQVMQEVLGVAETTALASEVALPLGVTLAAVGVAGSHGLLLRRDLAVREAVDRAEEAEALEAGVPLTLTGPAGGDLDAVVDALRRHLPKGYRLDR